jgi:hypothetical protein
MREYLRPWKLVTFSIGMAWLVWGSFYYGYSDWDLGVSVIMGGLAYLSAPWSVRVIWNRQWCRLPLALLCWLVTVDLSYYAYHSLMGNEMIRDANFLASSCLFWLCGFIWLYDGTLKEAWQTIRREAKH